MGGNMDKKEALEKVKENGWEIEEMSDELKKDKEIASAAIASQPGSIEFVDVSLLDDEELVTNAIIGGENGMLMQYAGPSLKKNKEFVMNLLVKTKDNYILEYADESLQEDEELKAQAQKNLD